MLAFREVFAQNTWTQGTNVGSLPRTDAIGFSLGNKGYIVIGYDMQTPFYHDFWEHTPCNIQTPSITPIVAITFCQGNSLNCFSAIYYL